MENVHFEQSMKVSESELFLAILPYGAGNALFETQPHLNKYTDISENLLL